MLFKKAILSFNDQTVELPANKMTFFDELYVDFKEVDKGAFKTYHLVIHPKQPIVIKNLELVFDETYSTNSGTQIFCNGFQSWSESREYSLKERIPKLKFWAKNQQYKGDEYISQIPRGKGIFHSWTYTHVRHNNEFSFAGSLKENAAFTYFIHDTNTHQLTVRKDCTDFELTHSYPILDIFVSNQNEQKSYENWFSEMDLPSLRGKPSTGWTSWYHYFTDISEDIILKNLNAFSEKEIPLDYFQIDDGYQTHVGDWINIKSSFPNGMAHVAQKVKQANYKPGIWLAPFICSEHSDIFKQKKHWLLKDQNGNPISLGKIKLWSGDFYALDFYHKEVQEYLMFVIHTFLQKWGFEFLKLDFLYAACIAPKKNQTRGQIMHDAMEFLRVQTGNKMSLGCGVPLGSAFGKIDFCRVGCDVHMAWDNTIERFSGYRERNSTLLSLRSILGRWRLNGNVFHSDPDVFILRKEKNKLTPIQQYTLLIINALCGNLVFTSDFVSDYSSEQWGEFNWIFELQKSEVKEVQNLTNDKYLIHFNLNGKSLVAACNLSNKKVAVMVKNQTIELESFETLVLNF